MDGWYAVPEGDRIKELIPFDLLGWHGEWDNDQKLKQSGDTAYSIWSMWGKGSQGTSPRNMNPMAASYKNGSYRFV